MPFAAVRDRRIHGAGIQVWWRMPPADVLDDTLPSELPVHTLDRAAHAVETEAVRIAGPVEVFRALIIGDERGY
ncbi:MAG: hypothetical protein ABMB14_29855 [Myxococcota bacterium]